MPDQPRGAGRVAWSVVVPTYRRPENLRILLESLAGQRLSFDEFEVIVIDDASGDETRSVMREASAYLPNLRCYERGQNSGPAAARNLGIEHASGGKILFLDDDIWATPDLLLVHAAFHDQHRDPWLGLLGRVDWHPSLRVTRFMRWLDRSGLQFGFDTWLEPGIVDEPYRAFYMANISLPKAALLEVGGFDERFPYPAFEDYELGWRLSERGFRLSYEPKALAYHTRPIDLRTFRRRTRMVAESAVLLKALHPEFNLAETLKSRAGLRRRLKLFAYAPVAGLVGDDERLGLAYRELLAGAYAEGRARGEERLAAGEQARLGR